jgi:hypothetical protein
VDWVLIVCGGFFIVTCVASLVAPRVSAHRRHVLEATGAPWYGALLPAAAGIPIVAAGVWPSVGTIAVAVAAFVGVALLSKRIMARVDDPPPGMAHLRERSMNPLPRLVHPIRSVRDDIELMKAVRNKDEQLAWEQRKGISRRSRDGGPTATA